MVESVARFLSFVEFRVLRFLYACALIVGTKGMSIIVSKRVTGFRYWVNIIPRKEEDSNVTRLSTVMLSQFGFVQFLP